MRNYEKLHPKSLNGRIVGKEARTVNFMSSPMRDKGNVWRHENGLMIMSMRVYREPVGDHIRQNGRDIQKKTGDLVRYKVYLPQLEILDHTKIEGIAERRIYESPNNIVFEVGPDKDTYEKMKQWAEENKSVMDSLIDG